MRRRLGNAQHAELFEQSNRGLRPNAGHGQQLEHGRGKLAAQFIEIGARAGAIDLVDFYRDGLCRRRTDPAMCAPRSSIARMIPHLRAPACAFVCANLEERLAVELHQRGDLAQPGSDFGVGHRDGRSRRTGQLAAPRSQERAPAMTIAPGRRRLVPAIFNLPTDKMRAGYYSDAYFNRVKEILERDGRHPRVLMQVFNKKDAVLCGIDEAIAILKLCSGRAAEAGGWQDGWSALDVRALYDGDRIGPYETVMTVEGDYSLFTHLETDYLGVLARRTRVATTNTSAVVAAASGKNVLFFPARFDHHLVQTGDGYAAYISGALGVSTDAQAEWWGSRGFGTVPHGLIAAYGGDTVLAVKKFAQHADPSINVIALVDFDNDSVRTAKACAGRRQARGFGACGWTPRRRSWTRAFFDQQMGTFDPTGVNAQLVLNVRRGLDEAGFDWVKIIVSGGFNVEKIRARSNSAKIPVDAYAPSARCSSKAPSISPRTSRSQRRTASWPIATKPAGRTGQIRVRWKKCSERTFAVLWLRGVFAGEQPVRIRRPRPHEERARLRVDEREQQRAVGRHEAAADEPGERWARRCHPMPPARSIPYLRP